MTTTAVATRCSRMRCNHPCPPAARGPDRPAASKRTHHANTHSSFSSEVIPVYPSKALSPLVSDLAPLHCSGSREGYDQAGISGA